MRLLPALLLLAASTVAVRAAEPPVATFSIVARDPATGELGVAVASRFFAVGAVVPYAKAGVGAIATQASANTTYGPEGLALLASGKSAKDALDALLSKDDGRDRRQVGIISATGSSATYTGPGTTPWAGGRSGPDYAVQGNILAGEKVVSELERAFTTTKGTLAERMYAALLAGEKAGGDSRGKQSAALLVVKARAGYGGFDDKAIDIRVDDHREPFRELGRLLAYAQMNYAWNEGWTAFMEKRFPAALAAQERAASLAPGNGEVVYDLAVIRLANGRRDDALAALRKAIAANPKLKTQAAKDEDLAALRSDAAFQRLVR